MINRRLRELREAAGLSQEDLAFKIHLTASTISNIETGKKKSLDIDLLMRYADFFRVPIESIIGQEKEQSDKNNSSYTHEMLTRIEYQLTNILSNMIKEIEEKNCQIRLKDKVIFEKDRLINTLTLKYEKAMNHE